MLRPDAPRTASPPRDHDATLEAMDLRLQLLLRRARTRQLAPQDLSADLATLRAHVVDLQRTQLQQHPVNPRLPSF